jgi:hypothetical protein
MRRAVYVSVGLIAILALCSFAQATPITITNPGFDATVDTTFTYTPGNFRDGTYTAGSTMATGFYVVQNGAISDTASGYEVASTASTPGYGFTGIAGIANFQAGQVGADPTGCIALLLNTSQGSAAGIAQTLPGSVSLQPNTLYTLTFDVYKRIVLGLPSSFAADLTVGGLPVGGMLAYTVPTDTTAGFGTVTYQTGSTVVSGDLGFRFATTDTTGNTTQIFVDNVTLTAIPEPGTITVCANGLGALLCYAWRRRK